MSKHEREEKMSEKFRSCPDCQGRGWVSSESDIGDYRDPHSRPNCSVCRGAGVLGPEQILAMALRYLATPFAEPKQ